MRRPRLTEVTYASLQKHWKALLIMVGAPEGIWALFKDYFRSKFMDWAVSYLGDFATWLFANPFSILTLSVGVALISLAVMVAKESPPESVILKDDEEYYPASRISRRFKSGLIAAISVIAILIGLGFYKFITRQDIVVEFHRSAFGEVRTRHVIASVLLDLKLINLSVPTTTRNWGLAIAFTDGETAKCGLVEKNVTANYSLSPSNSAIVDIREIKVNDLLSVQTAATPMQTGASISGPVTFTCPDYARETVGAPGTVLTLSFDDARGKHYRYHYTVPAKLGRIIFPDEPDY